MEVIQEAKLHNRFDIEVRDARTGKIKQKAYAENIILNQAWAQILAVGAPWFTTIKIGTGSGTISASRTTLFTQILSRNIGSVVRNYNPSESWFSAMSSILILETEFIGSVITEVGIGNATLCTHAMLKDMNGNPIGITKTDVDIITIYATVYLKIPAWDKAFNIDFIRETQFLNPLIDGLLGFAFTCPGGPAPKYPNSLNVFSTDCIPVGSYININYGADIPVAVKAAVLAGSIVTIPTWTINTTDKKASVYLRVPANSCNIGGIKGFSLSTKLYSVGDESLFCYLVVQFKSGDATQSTIIEQIGTGDDLTVAFSTVFPFVKDGAIIKIDGSIVVPTVIPNVPKIKNIRNYMRNLGLTGFGDRTGSSTDLYPNGSNYSDLILENPFCASYGIDSIAATNITLYTSDDMITWTQVYTGSGTYTVAAEHKQKQYWKATKAATTAWAITAINVDAFDALKNVVFASAPATGAVITAEYNTDVAAKDVNHVLDLTFTIQLGEYTP